MAPQDNNELNSLEDPGTVVEQDNTAAGQSASGNEAASATGGDTPKPKKSFNKRIQNLINRVNIYLLLFILIIVLAAGIVFVGYQRTKKEAAPVAINTQPLDAEALAKLKGSDAKVGDPKQTLSIESNAIFSGKVLVRDSLDVAGTIKVGGALNLPGITVSGTSAFDQIQANKLSIAGDTNIQGQLTVQKNLTITGGATFGGPISAPQITIQSLQLNTDIQLNRHIDAGGGTPGKTDGSALGSGGTSSVSGSDTAGTVTINTGGGPGAGCYITVNFAQRFNGTPHVVITPVGSGGAGLNYYVNRTTSNFSICSTNAPAGGISFSFDYVAID
jgi:cytoskeletal protein CcmA (bactofilin family)